MLPCLIQDRFVQQEVCLDKGKTSELGLILGLLFLGLKQGKLEDLPIFFPEMLALDWIQPNALGGRKVEMQFLDFLCSDFVWVGENLNIFYGWTKFQVTKKGKKCEFCKPENKKTRITNLPVNLLLINIIHANIHEMKIKYFNLSICWWPLSKMPVPLLP